MLYPTRLAAATCKGGSIVVGRKHQGRAVCSLPRGRNGALRARWAGGRGRAVMLCHAGAVTHIYFVYELFPPLSLHPRFAARTHRTHSAARPTVASSVHSPDRTHSPGTSLFFAHCHFSVAYLCVHARFTHVKAILLTQLTETLALIRAERAAKQRNAARYSNLRFALRNIREELKLA
jgi:hypothetical protein